MSSPDSTRPDSEITREQIEVLERFNHPSGYERLSRATFRKLLRAALRDVERREKEYTWNGEDYI